MVLVVWYLRHEFQRKKHLREKVNVLRENALNHLRICRHQREIREAAFKAKLAEHGDMEHSGAELSIGELYVGTELSVGAGHGMVCAGKRSPEVGDAVHGSAGVVGGGVGRLASYAMIDFVLYERLRRLGLLDCGVRGHNVGASDYSRHVIQPWSIWLDYELNPWDADIVKRVLRTKDGESRRLDYEKIIHICQERIRQLGG